MVPGSATMRNGKRKAEHQRHDSASKKAMEGYFRQAYATMNSSGRCDTNSGEEEEATDDESEFSSLDGRISPSRPVAWGAPAAAAAGAAGGGGGGASFNAAGHPHAMTQQGYAMASAAGGANIHAGMIHHQQLGMDPDAEDAARSVASTGWSTCSGTANAGYQQYQQQLLQQQQLQHRQQQQQQQQQQQHQQQLQQQADGRRMGRGGGARLEGDEWGWFVDAGEQQEQQQAHPGPLGVRRSAKN